MHAVFTLFHFNPNTSCIFNLYTNKASYLDWKNIAFIQCFIFFTHAANATQLINVEATIGRARAASKRFALKYR